MRVGSLLLHAGEPERRGYLWVPRLSPILGNSAMSASTVRTPARHSKRHSTRIAIALPPRSADRRGRAKHMATQVYFATNRNAIAGPVPNNYGTDFSADGS